jgi:hypothetical protein
LAKGHHSIVFVLVMRRFIDHITEFARSRTPEEWKLLAYQKVDESRVWVREHGEGAALGAFGLGIFIVIFFKLFVVILALVALAYLTIIAISESGR